MLGELFFSSLKLLLLLLLLPRPGVDGAMTLSKVESGFFFLKKGFERRLIFRFAEVLDLTPAKKSKKNQKNHVTLIIY